MLAAMQGAAADGGEVGLGQCHCMLAALQGAAADSS